MNKACPKDPFLVPKIDQLADAKFGHPRMSFLDAFQEYHQITLVPEDQEKTSFISPEVNYHYKVMSFRLKDAGSTYQRMVTRMFKDQLGRNMEAYTDDMVVKSKQTELHLGDLSEIFGVLRKHCLRLIASNALLGVGLGKFLGYQITHQGIEVNPDQIEAIHRLNSSWNPKEIQKLTRMAATLNYFISRLAEQ